MFISYKWRTHWLANRGARRIFPWRINELHGPGPKKRPAVCLRGQLPDFTHWMYGKIVLAPDKTTPFD